MKRIEASTKVESMGREDSRAAEAMNAIVRLLSPLEDDIRARILRSVLTFFETDGGHHQKPAAATSGTAIARPQFSDREELSPKEFLFQKQPKTDIERMACLAYYLTHSRNTPHFKTLDLAKLNTEAAQIKFSNAAYAANNAVKAGFLAPAPKGQRQITAAGEQFVVALPDREAAKKAISLVRRRKNARRKK